MKTNEFRISIAIEDKKSGEMVLLVVNDLLVENSIKLEDDDESAPPDNASAEVLPRGLEGTLTCSKAQWLQIKAQAVQQGVVWSQGMTKTKTPNTYWSAKPKVVVIHVNHDGIFDGIDKQLTIKVRDGVQRLWGSIDNRIARVVVRDPRQRVTVSDELQAMLDAADEDDANNF